MDKAPDAFRTISEVADELDVPQHVLRFWESRFPQIKPMKRGGGRRYYRPDDVDLLRGIRHLLYGEGYTIRGVQRILREQGGRHVQACWQEDAVRPDRRAPHAGDAEDAEDGDAGEIIAALSDGEDAADEEFESHAGGADAGDGAPAGSRRAPRLDGADAPADRRKISPEDLARLRGLLDGLVEAREKLDAAMKEAG